MNNNVSYEEVAEFDESNYNNFDKYITFSIDAKVYCLSVSIIRSIVMFKGYTYVPNLPSYYKGLINLRGDIVPIIDLFEKMNGNIGILNNNKERCLIVVDYLGDIVGLIVDYVLEVIDIEESKIVYYSDDDIDNIHNYITGVFKDLEDKKFILDYKKILK
ncbi:MAG: purine-binding chemotaxis protein CheW [Oscillospiraceae bacterium]|nr:purine-binding chemotaxis protein CheW [Oscillospiraceae bacterium]